MSSTRILILRLSSFGDIVQTLPTVDVLQSQNINVDFYTKPEFKYIVEPHAGIQNIYYFNKKKSLLSQVAEFKSLLKQNQYDVIYDAHSNNRTFLFRFLTLGFRLKINLSHFLNRKIKPLFLSKNLEHKITINPVKWVRRPKYRLRRLLYFKFKFRNVFPNPMIAAQSFLDPLIKTKTVLETSVLPKSINSDYNSKFKPVSQDYIVLAPSAAWPLKRWPTDYFLELIKLKPNSKFVVLGGPDDDFAHVLQGPNVSNLVGKLSWGETGSWILNAKTLIAADTGVLHWADYMGVKTIGILGPTAFGQPFRPSTLVLNQNLACSPCTKDGRGQCKIKETQKCLKDIKPFEVSRLMDKVL